MKRKVGVIMAMELVQDEKKVYLCRSMEPGQFKTQLFDNGETGHSRAYLKCNLSLEEHQQLLTSQDEFVGRILSSWRRSFHRMTLQNIYLYDNEESGYLIITIANETQFDKIDAQRIRKWGDELLKILTEYQVRALENAKQTAVSSYFKLRENSPQETEEQTIVTSAGDTFFQEGVPSEKVDVSNEQMPESKPCTAQESEDIQAEDVSMNTDQQRISDLQKIQMSTEKNTALQQNGVKVVTKERNAGRSTIPEIQEGLAQLLSELDDLKSSINDVQIQNATFVPLDESSNEAESNQLREKALSRDSDLATEEEEDHPYSDVEMLLPETNYHYLQAEGLASVLETTDLNDENGSIPTSSDQQLVDDTTVLPKRIKKGTLKIDRVLEEVNNLEKFNDEYKNYQYKNKRQISRISSKVLSAYLKNRNTRVNYRDLLSKMKNVEFISYLWSQVKLIRKEKNPIYFKDCDLQTLVEDAMDFYQTEIKKYLKLPKPKLTRKIQVPEKFFLLVEAYNDLEYYLENLLKENIENPIVLNRIAAK